jgi:hypothetical protein
VKAKSFIRTKGSPIKIFYENISFPNMFMDWLEKDLINRHITFMNDKREIFAISVIRAASNIGNTG